MRKTKVENELRRAWLRGVRKSDVDRALGALEQRNRELGSELLGAEETARGLMERVTEAEATLQTFHASLEHMGTILSLAEERAREIEREAEAEATRVREEAAERMREADEEVAALHERKREALDALLALRLSLASVGPEPEAPAATVHALPAPERTTLADLLAQEA